VQRPLDDSSPGAAVLRDYAQRWSLEPREAGFETNSSWLQRVFAPEPAVLKVAKPDSDERPGMALLQWWGASGEQRGAVSVWNRDADAVLMAEATEIPALDDASAFDDQTAFAVLVQTAEVLHRNGNQADEAPDGLVPLTAVRDHVFTLRAIGEACFDRWRPFAQALDLMGASPQPLHGDIHHGNVLREGRSGDWVVIDPKGLLGHVAYDFANLFFNPMDQPSRVAQIERMDWLANHIAANAQGVEGRRRVLEFAVLYGGMSLLWGWDDDWAPQRLIQFQMLETLLLDAA
jgi:streptomycin 6-kinase